MDELEQQQLYTAQLFWNTSQQKYAEINLYINLIDIFCLHRPPPPINEIHMNTKPYNVDTFDMLLMMSHFHIKLLYSADQLSKTRQIR